MNASPDDKDNVLVELTRSAIQASAWLERLHDVDTGAHSWFAGVTRRKTIDQDGKVLITRTLFYEAHESMAQNELLSMAELAFAKFDLAKLVLIHRLGEVPIGEASVVVGCSGAHRVSTLASIPWIMDRLKSEVPIWKRETFEDDSRQWIHPTGNA